MSELPHHHRCQPRPDLHDALERTQAVLRAREAGLIE